MLKIGSIRWKGRCARHSSYNPLMDGPGAIRGGCRRCQLLFEIYETHVRLIRLIREFGTREGSKEASPEIADRQMSLLE